MQTNCALHENETHTHSVVMHLLYEPLAQMTDVWSVTFYLLRFSPPSLHPLILSPFFSPFSLCIRGLSFFIFTCLPPLLPSLLLSLSLFSLFSPFGKGDYFILFPVYSFEHLFFSLFFKPLSTSFLSLCFLSFLNTLYSSCLSFFLFHSYRCFFAPSLSQSSVLP